MKRKNPGKKYNDDFKKTIVDLYHAGSSAKELSSEYGVSEVTIYKWIKEFTPVGEWEDSLTPKEMAAIQNEEGRHSIHYQEEVPALSFERKGRTI